MSVWTDFVKDFARRNSVSYGCALSMPECSIEYRKKHPKPVPKKKQKELFKEAVERGSMEDQDINRSGTPYKQQKAHKERVVALKSKLNKALAQKELLEKVGEKQERENMGQEDINKAVRKIKVKKLKKKKLIIEEDSDDEKPTPKEVAENITMVIEEKKKRGRKPKYTTDEDRRKAKREQTLASNKRKKAERQGKGFISNTYKKVANFGNKVIETAEKAVEFGKKVIHGRNDLSPKVKNILSQYGDQVIRGITINRTPVGAVLIGALSVASKGDFFKRFRDSPYDKLFHLRVDLRTDKGVVSLEKNEVINMDINPKTAKDAELQVIRDVPQDLTINELINNAKTLMGGNFYKYSARDNNCQDFIIAVLKGSSIGTPQDYEFVKQDTKSLFGSDSFLRKLSNTITDIGGSFDVILQGGKLSKDEVINNYGSVVKHLITHIIDPKEPIDPRDYKQTEQLITAIKKVKKGKGAVMDSRGNLVPIDSSSSDSDSGSDKEDPCWKGYKQKKNGKKVPNCVVDLIEGGKDSNGEAIEGGNIDFEKIKKGAFTRQLKDFNRKHKKKLNMEQFANYVIDHNEEFNTITHKRAMFYLNILNRKK